MDWALVWFRTAAVTVWLMTLSVVLFFGVGVVEMAAMIEGYGMFYAALAACLFTFAVGLLVLGLGMGLWLWKGADW